MHINRNYAMNDYREWAKLYNDAVAKTEKLRAITEKLRSEPVKPTTKEQSLPRSQAIKRILDIYGQREVDHITSDNTPSSFLLNDCQRGAVNELMAIFDIKEDDLK